MVIDSIRIGSTSTFLYFDLYLYSAYAAHYVYSNNNTLNLYSAKSIVYSKALYRLINMQLNVTESKIY